VSRKDIINIEQFLKRHALVRWEDNLFDLDFTHPDKVRNDFRLKNKEALKKFAGELFHAQLFEQNLKSSRCSMS